LGTLETFLSLKIASLYDTPMSETLERIKELVAAGEARISDHGYDELSADGLSASEIVDGVKAAELVEDYPTFAKGACVLVL
jgi:hypothetical protein